VIRCACRKFGGVSVNGVFPCRFFDRERMHALILRLVKIGPKGEGQATDVLKVERPGDLADIADIADLGLILAETKRLLASAGYHAGKRAVFYYVGKCWIQCECARVHRTLRVVRGCFFIRSVPLIPTLRLPQESCQTCPCT
jgi:hypothetical protein